MFLYNFEENHNVLQLTDAVSRSGRERNEVVRVSRHHVFRKESIGIVDGRVGIDGPESYLLYYKLNRSKKK